jgi:hypothetical protein
MLDATLSGCWPSSDAWTSYDPAVARRTVTLMVAVCALSRTDCEHVTILSDCTQLPALDAQLLNA